MAKNTESIWVLLTPSDFKGAAYYSNGDCPLARALKRKYKTGKIWVGGTHAKVNGKRFDLPTYDWVDFYKVKKEYAKGQNRKWNHYVEIVPQ
jgi:hypothetical protein